MNRKRIKLTTLLSLLGSSVWTHNLHNFNTKGRHVIGDDRGYGRNGGRGKGLGYTQLETSQTSCKLWILLAYVRTRTCTHVKV